MARIISITLSTLLILTSTASSELNIVTTVPDLAAIAQTIGGNHVTAKSISKGYQDPHYVQAKPSYMRLFNRADLLIYVGLELEVGWLPLIIQGARNPKIIPGAPGHLEASTGIQRLEVPEGQIDRSMGDIHPEGNPHYLLNSHNGLIVAQTIADKLSELDPDHAEAYRSNLERFQADLQTRIAQWETRIAHLRNRKSAGPSVLSSAPSAARSPT